MDYKNQGEIVELRFYLKAFEIGMIVSKPFGDNARYDFIVDRDGRLSRIQIKSTGILNSEPGHHGHSGRYRIYSAYGASRKRHFSKEHIDFLVAYIIPKSVWYIIPIEVTNGKKTIHLNIGGHGKYEQYRDRWDLF